jgi:hypothetical protein
MKLEILLRVYSVLSGRRIPVEKALKDLLREYSITLEDLLTAMRIEDIDVYEELIKRLAYPSKDAVAYIYSLPWRLAAIALFTIQAFYIVNPSGQYKGYLLEPPRENIVSGDKILFRGLLDLITRLKNIV